MADMNESTIRVIPFSGERKDFRMWSGKFLAQAEKMRYREALDGDLRVPEADEELSEEDTEKKKAREMNKNAYASLILACTSPTTFSLVDKAKTKALPKGDAALAWKNLQNKYERKTRNTLVSLKAEFSTCKLQRDAAPDEWFDQLEYLRQRIETIGSTMSDEDMIAHILGNLTDDYSTLKDMLGRAINKEDLSLSEIQEEIFQKYEELQDKKKSKRDKQEIALYAKFKGNCHYCGKQGHRQFECNLKKKNEGTEKANEKSNTGGRVPVKCYICKKIGHKAEDCWHNEKNKNKRTGKATTEAATVTHAESEEVNFMTQVVETCIVIQDNNKDFFWIADSGASSHMKSNCDGLTNIREYKGNVKIGDGSIVKSTLVGDYKCMAIDSDGKQTEFTLRNVKVVPSLWCNLFSITKAMKQGATIKSNKMALAVQKGSVNLTFQEHQTKEGAIMLGTNLIPVQGNHDIATSTKEGTKIDINKAHCMLGHASMAIVKSIANARGWHLTGQFQTCEACSIAKSKQKNVPKATNNENDDKFYFDLSTIKTESYGKRKYWLLIVHGETKMKWSFFLKAKDELSEVMMMWIDDIRSKGQSVKTIRCDNAGENLAFKDESKKKQLGVIFEFTAPNTPQQNGVVERAFAFLQGRVRAVFEDAAIHGELRGKLWAEAANTVTMLDNLVVSDDNKTRYEKFFGKLPPFVNHLRTFGEIGIVANRAAIQSKMNDRGQPMMFVGYSLGHAGDVYRMLNLSTTKVIHSRDVIFLNKSYGNYMKDKGMPIWEGRSDGVIIEELDYNTDDSSKAKDSTSTPVNEKERFQMLPREVRNLQTFYNNVLDQIDVAMLTQDNNTTTIEEAKASSNHEKWNEAMMQEFNNFEQRSVWAPVKRDSVPKSKKILKTKWVLKQKPDGTHRARLVAKGFTQVPGVDFTESFSPVINDVTMRILIVFWIMNKYYAAQVDVETAFLCGELDEEIYIESPEGYNLPPDEVLLLKKAMYGLVQAARQFWKLFANIMKDMGFIQSMADPCLYFQQVDNSRVYVIQYVDDALIIGDEHMVKQTLTELKKHVIIKESTTVKEYVGCFILHDKEKGRAILHQTRLIESLEKEYKHDKSKSYKTPAQPGSMLTKSSDPKVIEEDKNKEYRSTVGKLLYLLKHSRPDLANAVRDLSKVLDDTEEIHYKAMKRCVQFVLATRGKGLKIAPDGSKEMLTCVCDASYAPERNVRKSITGWIIMLFGVLISWKSRMQKSVTLSSSEAEYVAVSEMCTEILFIKQVIETMGIKVFTPISVYTDNLGAIYMIKNWTTDGKTKHVDTRYHFIRELQHEGVIEVKFVGTKDNDANMFTKNIGETEYNRFMEKYMDNTNG
jgi:Reverse transcriptase (RNA-dependent DNA polymerase)/gag-polypeptide of LTR copia-type